MGPVDVKIAGIVALPNADSMFQAIGVSRSLAPQAPPDNVLLMPMQQWRAIFGPQSSARPDAVRTEIHVRFDRSILPPDPSAAFIQAQRMANNFEARVAGSAALTDNLAAQLDAVRADALYARVLFLFLGIPGIVLALLVTLRSPHPAQSEGVASRRCCAFVAHPVRRCCVWPRSRPPPLQALASPSVSSSPS